MEDKKEKLKVGDRVRLINDSNVANDELHNGMTGIVRFVDNSNGDYGICVEFDNFHNGHGGSFDNLNIPNSAGWYLRSSYVEKITNSFPRFKVGDKVIGATDVDCYDIKGKVGTILRVNDYNYTVKFPGWHGGHNGDEDSNDKDCLFCVEAWIRPYADNTVVPKNDNNNSKNNPNSTNTVYPVITITTDGCKTTAVMRRGHEVLHTASVKCHHDDIYDYDIGVTAALARLIDNSGDACGFTGDAVCVDTDGFSAVGYTLGKIYHFVNGVTHDDDNESRPIGYPIANEDELRKYGFIAIKN